MSRWFRHYAGLCRDAKLISVAIKSKQTIERVVWVYSAILESASEIDDGGRYQIDHAEIAYFLRADESDISSVEDALCSVQRVSDGIVVKWADRQFQSDRSAERTRRYRDRNAGSGDNDKHAKRETSQSSDVTSQTRHCDAPETETETETDISSLRSDSADAPQPNFDLNSEIQIKPEPIAKPKTTKPTKPVKTALDPRASPTADDRTYAANLGMTEATLANEWEKFKLNHIQRQTRAIDWAMTWQTWARNWVGYGARNVGDKPWATASPKPSFTEIRPAGLESVPVHETEEEANRWWHNRMMGTAQ